MGVDHDCWQRVGWHLGACGAQEYFVAQSRFMVVHGLGAVHGFVQVAIGVAVVNRNKIEYPAFHAFYGFVAIIAIAIIYSYRAQLKSRVYLLYGFGGLFIMGLGIRAVLVGQAG